jgi:hypothetical protein
MVGPRRTEVSPDLALVASRVKLRRTSREYLAFPPEQQKQLIAALMAGITSRATLTPPGIAPAPASSGGPVITPTRSRNLATPAPATTGRPRSGSSTSSHSQ